MHTMLNETDISIFDKAVLRIVDELYCHKNIQERLPTIIDILKPVYKNEHKEYIFNKIKNYRYNPRIVQKQNIQLVLSEIQNFHI